jgi:MFS family permease
MSDRPVDVSTAIATPDPMPTAPSPWQALFRDGRAVYTVALNLGIGLHAVDVFVISTVMPAVVRDLGGVAYYAWATMLYMIASIMGAASGNTLRAALGARRGYGLAGLIFLAGTAGASAAPTMAALLAARFVQGLGGGLIVSQSMGLVRELYDESVRTRVLATISAMWGIAALLGPMLGGVFGEIGWWRGAFVSTLPLIALFVLLAWRTLPPAERAASVPHLPIRRLLLLGGGVLCVGVGGTTGWLAFELALLLLAGIMVYLTFRLDAEAEIPLFPARAISLNHRVGVAFAMFFLMSMTHSTAGLFLPLALQVLHGVGPLEAGYYNAILALSWTAASFLTAGWKGRAEVAALAWGPAAAAAALAFVAAGLAWMPPIAIGVCMAVTGLGIGASSLHLTAATMAGAPKGEEGRTASTIPTVRMLGIAFGSAGAGLLANLAGLAGGISIASVAAAGGTVITAAALSALAVFMLALRLLAQRRAAAAAE